jgi:hypothetical protein
MNPDAVPIVQRDLHVFHWPTHSAVETILVRGDKGCDVSILPHEHTPDGRDLFREVNTFPTSDGAEQFIAALRRDAQQRTGQPAIMTTVIRHTPEPPRYAIKIDAGNDDNGNPRRGWLIYAPAGDYLGFVNEGYEGPGALKRIGTVVELGAVPTTARFYRSSTAKPHANRV